MLSFTDQVGRTIKLSSFPKRIVSLVPSQTELLFDLGLQDEVIGITKFCIYPNHWFRTKTSVGGTKTVNLKTVRNLQPDLILANKEENTKGQIESLATDYPIFVSDVHDLDSALAMIQLIGEVTNKKQKANTIYEQIRSDFATFSRAMEKKEKPNTTYLIWKDPYMTVGGDTFIHSMMTLCGLKNTFENKSRYPQISIDDIYEANCELLLLSSEPYPFKQQHVDQLQASLPNTTIMLVNGEIFSWYGSRLLYAASYFSALFQGNRQAFGSV